MMIAGSAPKLEATEHEIVLGDEVQILCSVKGPVPLDSTVAIYISTSLSIECPHVNGDNVSVQGNIVTRINKTSCTFQIEHSQSDDMGNYGCKVHISGPGVGEITILRSSGVTLLPAHTELPEIAHNSSQLGLIVGSVASVAAALSVLLLISVIVVRKKRGKLNLICSMYMY